MAVLDTLSRMFGGAAIGDARLSPLDIAYATRSETLINDRDANYALYRRYYKGDQDDPRRLDFGTRTEPSIGGFRAQHNFCSLVIDLLAERLNVTGFTVTGDGISEEQGEAVAKHLWAWWQAARMDAVQLVVHTETPMEGDAYLIADFDAAAGRPRWAFHGCLEVIPVYDAMHRMRVAYKRWEETYTEVMNGSELQRTRQRITKYQPALIEKFVNVGRGWELWTEDVDAAGNPDGGVIDWRDGQGRPLGIPVVHFKNKPLGEDFGWSELADAIPIQDEYNRRVWFTSEGISYAGNTQKYIIDGRLPAKVKDTDDKQGGFVSGPGRVWAIGSADSSKGASAGAFPPSDVAALQDATDRELKTFAAQTRTPAHMIDQQGPLPSGESLKVAESGLVSKATNRSVGYGNAWEDAMKLGIRLWNAFGSGAELPEPETLTLSAQWAPFATRSELLEEQVIASRREDIGRDQANRERGYSQEEIDQINAAIEAATPEPLRGLDAFGGASRTQVNDADA
jgi:hypothetical protein